MSALRAAQTIDKNTLLIDVGAPTLGAGQMITQPLFVGVCGTDLQIIRQQRLDPATILGHEGVACIFESTSTEKGMQPGNYVVFNPVDPTDQNQILGHNTPGLLQQQYLVTKHAIKNNLVVPFPMDIDPMLGALVEPLGTVTYGHVLVSKATKQSIIAIVGAGAIGIMHALYAKAQGYEKVLLINASRDHLDWCIQRGIVDEENIFLDSENLPAEILAATQGLGVDAVYMCTSRPNALTALQRALRYVKAGGCIDLVGGIKDGDTINELPGIEDLNAIRRANFCGIPSSGYLETTTDIRGKAIHFTGHRGTSLQHFKDTIESLRNHGHIFSKVISHVVSLEACVTLFNAIAKGRVREFNGVPYIKAVVDLNMTGNHVRNS
jgi:threonine dehydrogenase-like Zn-dependent dehydrogenase